MRAQQEDHFDFSARPVGDGVFQLTAPPKRFRQYLVCGGERALLIDTGFGLGSLCGALTPLTALPILLANTHGHPDHGGGNAEFGAPLLHEADFALYAAACTFEARRAELEQWGLGSRAASLQPTPPAPLPLADGAVLDLGGRRLTAIHTPGHTRGSVCFFEAETGLLFAGDNLNGMQTMLTEHWAAPLADYIASLRRLAALPVRAVWTGHDAGALPPDIIERKLRCALALAEGAGEAARDRAGNPVLRAESGGTAVCCTAEKLK